MKCGTSGVIWPIAEEEKKIFFFCQRILACNLVVCRRRKIFLLLGFRSLIMYQIWRRSKFLLQIQTYEMWDFMAYMHKRPPPRRKSPGRWSSYFIQSLSKASGLPGCALPAPASFSISGKFIAHYLMEQVIMII